MNRNKRGGQYKFPGSFIKWETIWKQWVDYRGLEGITRFLAKMGFIPRYNDYTTIWHRVHDMIPEIKLPTEKELEVASDGSGLKTNNAGEYRVFRYGEKRKKKHLVVVITVDIKHKKLLEVEAHIEGEGKSEPQIAEKHLEELRKEGTSVKKFYGDGAFDTHSLFECLDESRIESDKDKKECIHGLLQGKQEKERRGKGVSQVRIRSMGYRQGIWHEMGGNGRDVLRCKAQVRREHGQQKEKLTDS